MPILGGSGLNDGDAVSSSCGLLVVDFIKTELLLVVGFTKTFRGGPP